MERVILFEHSEFRGSYKHVFNLHSPAVTQKYHIRIPIRNYIIAIFAAFIGFSVATAASVTPIPEPEFIPAESDVSLTKAGGYQVLVEKSFTLQAGEMRRVFGGAQFASSVSSDVYVETHLRCVGPGGIDTQQGAAAQNHEGKDTPLGDSYPWMGQLALYPLLLFRAPTTGTYQCHLLAGIGDPGTLTALARDYDNFSITWLKVSAANDAGASWWQNLPCDEPGNYSPTTGSWCLYLGGASHQSQLYVFDNDGSPANTWRAASDAAFVDASDSLMLTTCYSGTRSCTDGNRGDPWPLGDSGTVVDSHLELIQLDYAGGMCNITQSPENRSTVGNHAHHYMIYHSLEAVPIYPQCSRLFKLRISVKYVSGNPVKIDGPGFTHAFAINSIYGTAPPVPYLIGLTEDVARNYITAAGYAVSKVSSSLNTAPAGSVISQDPTAGVIELPGSAVNFTVSAGGVTLPDLRMLSQSSATGAITALGLVPSVSFSNVCKDPLAVTAQSPPAGTLVAPSSTVHITVDSGNRQTCPLQPFDEKP